MSISDFHNAEQFHPFLHHLAEDSQSDFNKTLENLSSGGEDATVKVADLIVARKDLLAKSDVGKLLKVGKHLVESGASLESPSLKTISALCMDLIGKAPSLDSMPEVNALFLDRPAVEKAYVADLLSTLSAQVRQNIVQILAETPADQTIPLLESLIDVLKNITDSYARAVILAAIAEIPQNQRENVITSAMPLLQDITRDFEIAKILETISIIPLDQRENVIKLALPFVRDTPTGNYTASILRAISKIPLDQRENVIELVCPLKDITGDSSANILEALAGIPQNQRKDVLDSAMPLFANITYFYDREMILKAIADIPQEQRRDVIDSAMPFSANITNHSKIANILRAFAQIPKDQRKDISQFVQPLIENIVDFEEKRGVFKAIAGIQQDQRVSVINTALLFIRGVKGPQQVEMLLALSQIPQEQRDPKIIGKLVPFFINPRMNEYPWQDLLIAIKQLPGQAAGPDITQAHILNKFKQYFILLGRDLSTLPLIQIEDFDLNFDRYESVISLIGQPKGHCNGFAFIKSFYSALGREDEFFKIMGLFSEWDGTLDSLSKKEPVQNLSRGYQNFQELMEGWINDIIWFQQNPFLIEGKKATQETSLKRKEQLQFVAPNTHVDIIEPYQVIQNCTVTQLTTLLKKYSESYRGSIVDFGGERHAVSLKVQADGSIDYYDPNFPVRLKPFNDMELLSRHIFNTKYRKLNRYGISADGTPVFVLVTMVYNLSKIPTPTDLPKTQ